MREKYHIKINRAHIKQFEEAIRRLNVKYEFACGVTEGGAPLENDYIVELSKYELLYLRLSCQSGKIINIADAS